MTYKFVHVYLSNSDSEELKLTYEVRQHKLGQLWAESIKRAMPGGFRENDRLYNFKCESKPYSSDIFDRLDSVISELQKIHPELNLPSLDRADIKGSINRLHVNFCHSKSCFISEYNSRLWSDLNIFLHELEAFERNESAGNPEAFPMAEIFITWRDVQKTLIAEEDFAEFDIEKTFGTAYFLYAQVGRHIFEIYMAQDKDVPHSQIQPARFFSADTNLWFGPDLGHWSKNLLFNKMKLWFADNLDLEKKLGLSFEDPKLAIGQVAVGRLVKMPYSDNEKKSLIKRIARFSAVNRVEVE